MEKATAKGSGVSFGGNENVLKQISVTGAHLCGYTSPIVCYTWMNCIMCGLKLL